jgi:hypothetical protein
MGSGASVAAALFIYLFCFFTPIGFLGANFFYYTELAPIRLCVAMASISTANHWLWNFIGAECFLDSPGIRSKRQPLNFTLYLFHLQCLSPAASFLVCLPLAYPHCRLLSTT